MRMLSRRRLAALAAVGVVAGLGGAAVAVAQGSSSTSQGPPAAVTAEQDAFLAALAKNLGVDVAKLKSAIKDAALERLDAAVKAGTITSDEAAEIRKAIEAGNLPLFGLPLRGPHGMHGMHGDHGAMLSAAADYLGLTSAELVSELRSGKSLADVAKAKGKSVDGLEQAMLNAAKAKLDAAVKAGRLTADEAKQILDRLQAKISDIVNGTLPGPPGFEGHHFGHGFGSGHDFGPHRGMGLGDGMGMGYAGPPADA